ncbi:MAG: DNA mismatch repair protein MutS [Bacteroidetes bacterium]|nr:DNA mismatch repair protein MutS [Bacteroidota bacterium]
MKIGDKVDVLDDDISGIITKITSEIVTVMTEDEFEIDFSATELVVVQKKDISDKELQVDKISSIISEKEQTGKPIKRIKSKERGLPPMEVDLHIHQLVKYTKGMSNYDMLILQADTAKRKLDFAISKKIQKIVFIHGVGQGVLRAELEFLFKRYDNLKFYDADFQKYGKGAVEVYIFQNKNV